MQLTTISEIINEKRENTVSKFSRFSSYLENIQRIKIGLLAPPFKKEGKTSRVYMSENPIDEHEAITIHDGMATLHLGDCIEVCKRLAAEGVRVHSIVCDPPYEIGFMGREWDSAGVAFDPATWAAIGEVLLPGGHLLAFTSTRTYHRIAVAIEDAGFEIRDQIQWLYGTGFPKNHDISKSIDRQTVRDMKGDLVFGRDWDRIYAVTNAIREARDASGKSNRDIDARFGKSGMAGHWTAAETNTQPAIPQWDQWLELKQFLEIDADEHLDNEVWVLNGRKGEPGEGWTEREVIGSEVTADALAFFAEEDREAKVVDITNTNTEIAKDWEGWGTALKPANEPIVVARKPISERTVAQNCVKHGTGAMNLDASRVGTMGGPDGIDLGSARYPANVLLSHTDECVKTGTERIDRGQLRDFSGMDAYPAEAGEKRDHAEDSRNDIQKGENFEIVDIYDCHESCPVRKINETGDGSAKFFANFGPEEVVDLKGENNPIVLARKPMSEKNTIQNIMLHGVGGLNIDATRIKSDDNPKTWETPRGGIWTTDSEAKSEMVEDARGRFPTNTILGGSEIVEEMDDQSGEVGGNSGGDFKNESLFFESNDAPTGYKDTGGASRFFHKVAELEGENNPIIIARKPLSEKTVIENVLLHGTGAMNIDATRIKHDDPPITRADMTSNTGDIFGFAGRATNEAGPAASGRFPANILLGHTPECLEIGSRRVNTSMGTRGAKDNIGDEQGLFGMKATGQEVGYADADGKEAVPIFECSEDCPIRQLDLQSGTTSSAKQPETGRTKTSPNTIYQGGFHPKKGQICPEYGDEGGASRYFKSFNPDSQAIGDWPTDDDLRGEEE